MKTAAIICEYNPFHNGHLYHIQQTRNAGATHIVCVLSSNFVQRGDVALLNKFDRAALALQGGADLVLELPTAYSMSSAEFYAGGAVSMLRQLGCVEELSFGSECGKLPLLLSAAEASLEACSRHSEELQALLRQGMPYPAAVSRIACRCADAETMEILQSPNNLLGVEYIKAILKQNAEIRPFTIERKSAAHDSTTMQDGFTSGSFLRNALKAGDNACLAGMPDFAAKQILAQMQAGNTADLSRLETTILYRIRTISAEELQMLPDVNETLLHRILAAKDAKTLEELLERIKTRHCTMARIRRILLYALIGIRQTDSRGDVPYGRILALNQRGSEILKLARQSGFPVSTSLSKLREAGKKAERIAEIEETASDIYGLSRKNITSAQEDFRAKIRMEDIE